MEIKKKLKENLKEYDNRKLQFQLYKLSRQHKFQKIKHNHSQEKKRLTSIDEACDKKSLIKKLPKLSFKHLGTNKVCKSFLDGEYKGLEKKNLKSHLLKYKSFHIKFTRQEPQLDKNNLTTKDNCIKLDRFKSNSKNLKKFVNNKTIESKENKMISKVSKVRQRLKDELFNIVYLYHPIIERKITQEN